MRGVAIWSGGLTKRRTHTLGRRVVSYVYESCSLGKTWPLERTCATKSQLSLACPVVRLTTPLPRAHLISGIDISTSPSAIRLLAATCCLLVRATRACADAHKRKVARAAQPADEVLPCWTDWWRNWWFGACAGKWTGAIVHPCMWRNYSKLSFFKIMELF